MPSLAPCCAIPAGAFCSALAWGDGHIGEEIFRGATGIAGEIGHTTVAVEGGYPCRCSLTGYLEAEVGSAALVRRTRYAIANLMNLERVINPRKASGPPVFGGPFAMASFCAAPLPGRSSTTSSGKRGTPSGSDWSA
ncbi:MAG: ROK family protein [Rhodobacterales bacterium]|nr:ROK family protein [Rhodobacterales bacterium]